MRSILYIFFACIFLVVQVLGHPLPLGYAENDLSGSVVAREPTDWSLPSPIFQREDTSTSNPLFTRQVRVNWIDPVRLTPGDKKFIYTLNHPYGRHRIVQTVKQKIKNILPRRGSQG
ncbi:hypothetical protein CC2G_002952 [Coprinopsis cinerea AmutBmut pab1-1]|nr:hypothetical protein CC2G_002952 [Coprinopsis cinerea AmutBmut pab1-1]